MDTRAAATNITIDEISSLIDTFQIAQKSCFPCIKKSNAYIQALEALVQQNASGVINEQSILNIITLAFNSLKANDKAQMILAGLTSKIDPRIVAAVNQGLELAKGDSSSIQPVIANVVANPEGALQFVLSAVSINAILVQAKKLGVNTDSLKNLLTRAGADLQVATQVYTTLKDKLNLLNDVAKNYSTLMSLVNPIIANLNISATANAATLFGRKSGAKMAQEPVAQFALR